MKFMSDIPNTFAVGNDIILILRAYFRKNFEKINIPTWSVRSIVENIYHINDKAIFEKGNSGTFPYIIVQPISMNTITESTKHQTTESELEEKYTNYYISDVNIRTVSKKYQECAQLQVEIACALQSSIVSQANSGLFDENGRVADADIIGKRTNLNVKGRKNLIDASIMDNTEATTILIGTYQVQSAYDLKMTTPYFKDFSQIEEGIENIETN